MLRRTWYNPTALKERTRVQRYTCRLAGCPLRFAWRPRGRCGEKLATLV